MSEGEKKVLGVRILDYLGLIAAVGLSFIRCMVGMCSMPVVSVFERLIDESVDRYL